MVQQTRERSGWSIRQIIDHLGIGKSSYYRHAGSRGRSCSGCDHRFNLYQILPEERQAIINYALAHGELRHRELA